MDDDIYTLSSPMPALTHSLLLSSPSGIFTSDLPAIDLQQPHKVLGEQFIAVRKTRANSQNKEIRAMQNASGSLQDKEMDMLRHSFSLLAGEALAVFLLKPASCVTSINSS